MIEIKGIPFLRVFLPFLAGAICVLQGFVISHLHLFFIISFIALGISFLAQEFHKPFYAITRRLFVGSAAVFLFLLAFEAAHFYNAKKNPDHYSHYAEQQAQEFIVTVNDMPVATGKSLKLQLEIQALKQGDSWHYTTGNSILYIRQPVTLAIRTGSRLLVKAKLSSMASPQNPGEFDYKTFLEHRNIFHTAYTEEKEVHILNALPGKPSIKTLGIAIKEYVVQTLRQAGLSQDAFSICTALLVGYDDEISSDVMQSFSHSGTLHVLSVSGMHTGILYLALMFLFARFDKHNRYKKARCFLMILALLLFTAITGFSPSVLRAALMLTLMLLGKTFSRNSNAYNSLLFSAFLLLLYNPYFLADVGFLLSYLAVFGIIYLFPILNSRYYIQNRFLRFAWELSLMSVAATLFTLPLTLYCFHQFPVWFIFSNLIIIPLSTVLMGAAFALLLCVKVVFLKQALALLINKVTAAMLATAHLTDSSIYGFMDYIPFAKTDVIFSTIWILLLLWFLATKSFRAMAAGLLCSVLWVSASVFVQHQELNEQDFVVFSVKHKSAYLLRSGHTVYLRADSLSESEFSRYVKPYLLRYSNLHVVADKSDVWHIQNKTKIITRSKTYGNTLSGVNFLIARDNVPLNLEPVKQNKLLVIADCSNSYTFVKQLKKQCAALGIGFYSVRESGAFKQQF